ncbi:unnamed protein product [Adineta ricciae]|uniref:Uncharacterized protein n=1 Tax=Adineta ricciae TaxID=249248 RepID=A0A815S5G8_ADIRI|nr:unnamed protein product [Adineta ricciae]
MSIKQQTKMMKMVCRQAALMRAPYHSPPWLRHAANNVEKKEKISSQTSKSMNKKKKLKQHHQLKKIQQTTK